MTDLAQLVLAVDSSGVKQGTAALDGLTAAGARAEAAASGVGLSSRGAAAEATAMAAAAQASARAVMGQAAGFGVATEAARVNTMAMRESLVVARELARGNFTRIPGSLTLLAQGIGSQGGISNFVSAITRQLGLVRTLQNAELAEQATAAAASASAVEGAARRAAANIAVADTEVALAEAQLRLTRGTSAEAAAQVRLAEAHGAVAAAAAEAAIAEDALGVAMGRAMETGAASAASTTASVTGLGAALGITAIAAGLAGAAFKEVKDSADEIDPSAKQFISTLGLTRAEIRRLKDETVTWGDVTHATFDVLARDAGTSSSQISGFFHEAFLETAQVGVSAAQTILGAFAAMVKGVHTIMSDIGDLAEAPFDPKALARLTNPIADAEAQFKKTFGNVGQFFHQDVPNAANQYRDQRLRDEANKLIDERNPRKPRKGPRQPVDHAEDMSARLDEQILAAKERLAGTAQEQAGFALQQITIEQNKTIADAKSLLAQHRITAGEEQHIELQAHQLADLKAQAVIREEQTKLLTQQQAAQDQLYGFATDALKFADQMATTAAEHRKAQLDMLDIAYRQKAYDLQILEAKQKLAGDTAAAALTQAQINQLPLQKSQQQALVNRNTMNPLEAWEQQVPKSAKEITQALQSIEVNGLDSLASAIAGVVTGTESLGKAFKDVSTQIISDIVQMTIKMLLFRAISSIFGGGTQSFNLGYSSAQEGGFAASYLAGTRASGGPVSAGSLYVVGEQGPEFFRPSQSGTIIPHGAANSNSPSGDTYLTVQVDAKDAVLTETVKTWIVQGIVQAAPSIIKQSTTQTIKTLSRPKISGGR